MIRIVAILTFACLVSGAPRSAAADLDLESARNIFETECSNCHSLDRPLKKSKSRQGWEKTVNRMKSYASGMISNEEAATIVEYLVRVRGPQD